MVFATAARHDQTLARRQSAIGGPDSEAFKAPWPITEKLKEGRMSLSGCADQAKGRWRLAIRT